MERELMTTEEVERETEAERRKRKLRDAKRYFKESILEGFGIMLLSCLCLYCLCRADMSVADKEFWMNLVAFGLCGYAMSIVFHLGDYLIAKRKARKQEK